MSVHISRAFSHAVSTIPVVGIALAMGCSRNTEATSSLAPPPPAVLPPPASVEPLVMNPSTAPSRDQAGRREEAAVAAGVSGAITVSPYPVPVCEKSGQGAVTVSWKVTGSDAVQVHIDSPSGALFCTSGGAHDEKTGAWVHEGLTFYLQNVANGAPLTYENTIATFEVTETVPGPCR
jgi:hypothetical protein